MTSNRNLDDSRYELTKLGTEDKISISEGFSKKYDF